MVRVIVISDTHGSHGKLNVPDGDILLHCGDFTMGGKEHEITAFNAWLESLPHTHKIVVPGNHDLLFQDNSAFARYALLTGATVLIEEGVSVEGLQIWGSPWTPEFYNWAFNYPPKDAERRWANIPQGLDILVTHGPPQGILDMPQRGASAGCPELLKRVQETKPRFHCFGHIHECGGILETTATTFVNASMVDLSYRKLRIPLVFDL